MFFLGNTWGLLLGLLLYYILTSMSVYIMMFIQPKVLGNILDSDNPFSGSIPDYTRTFFTTANLHKGIFRYLFRNRKAEWLIIPSRDIKTVLKILKLLTLLIYPYLIIGLIWLFLKLWFSTHFLYSPLQISLGSIQAYLNTIEQLEWLKSIKENELWFFFGCGILFALTIFLYSTKEEIDRHNENSERITRGLHISIICLSILGNISFFGAAAGDNLSVIGGKLKDLKFEIIAIHGEIFKKATSYIAYDDLVDSLEKENSLGEKQLIKLRIDSSKWEEKNVDSTLWFTLRSDIGKIIKEYDENNTYHRAINFPVEPPNNSPPDKDNPSTSSHKEDNTFSEGVKNYAHYASNHHWSDIGDDFNSYFPDPNKWTLGEGRRIKNEIENTTEKFSDKVSFRYKLYKCFEQIVGAAISAGLDAGTEKIAHILEIPARYKDVLRITSILSDESFKPCVLKKAMIWLGNIHAKVVSLTGRGKCSCPPRSENNSAEAYSERIKQKIQVNIAKTPGIRNDRETRRRESEEFAKNFKKLRDDDFKDQQKLAKENEGFKKRISSLVNKLQRPSYTGAYSDLINEYGEQTVRDRIIRELTQMSNGSVEDINLKMKNAITQIEHSDNLNQAIENLSAKKIIDCTCRLTH